MSIQEKLFELQDLGYKEFQSKLIPNIAPELIIGVRTPVLRKYAKEIAGTDEAEEFLKSLPHEYYDEDNLHAFLIENEKDFDKAIALTEKFLPYIDNWATCDMFLPPVFRKNTDKLLPYIRRWINDLRPYTVRYAIGLLMSLYLDELFTDEFPRLVSAVESEEYYVEMMIAWYFATALAKQYESVIDYFTGRILDRQVHNKALQKAIESKRISRATKAYLRELKIK